MNTDRAALRKAIEDYVDAIAPAPDWLKRSWAESKKNGTDKLTMREIDAIIADVRAKATKNNSRKRS